MLDIPQEVLKMKFIDLLNCIDEEQVMTVCILACNHTDVNAKIAGTKDSICKMIDGGLNGADVSGIAARKDNTIMVWLEDNR